VYIREEVLAVAVLEITTTKLLALSRPEVCFATYDAVLRINPALILLSEMDTTLTCLLV